MECECGHLRDSHTWVLPSTGETHKFRSNCDKCNCNKFKEIADKTGNLKQGSICPKCKQFIGITNICSECVKFRESTAPTGVKK